MIPIIDRYIASCFVLSFIRIMVICVTIFLVFESLRLIIGYDVNASILVRYHCTFLPRVMYMISSAVCLLATVFTIFSMNKSWELTALFSMGMSPARVALPIFIVVSLIAGFNFWFGDEILPQLNQKRNLIRHFEIKKGSGLYSSVNLDRVWYRSKNALFYIKALNTEKSIAQGLSLYYFDSDWNLIQLIVAKTVQMDGATWSLKEGTVTLFSKGSSSPQTKTFEHKIIKMDKDVADLKSSGNSSKFMSLSTLRRVIASNRKAGLDATRYEVSYQERLSFPFTTLAMFLLGLPFGVARPRSSERGGLYVLLCIVLSAFSWLFYSSSISLGKQGIFSPLIAAWAPSVLIIIISMVVFLHLRR